MDVYVYFVVSGVVSGVVGGAGVNGLCIVCCVLSKKLEWGEGMIVT